MASELLKNRALIQKLKEPETEDISFGLADSALDYSIESIEEDILPEAKPVELFEERERVRTERLSDTLTKIGGGLMDESVDFIKRENFFDGGRKFSSEDIEKFKELRKTMSSSEITEALGMSESYQTTLAKKLGLPSKTGKRNLAKKIAESESVIPTIKKLIDPTKSPTENYKKIYPKIKDKIFKKGTTAFGKPTYDRVRRAISNALMDVNQLSVEEYKNEIRKMVADRAYEPKGLDPLGMKTDKLKNYSIPNYKQAKAELAKEIPSLDKKLQTNIGFRKRLKMKKKEIEDPSLKLSRLSKKGERKVKNRLKKIGLTSTLSPREQAINQTQRSIQKSSNDKIKTNPKAMIKFLNDNPKILKALGTRVNRQTGEIFYENPNLNFLNKNPEDTARFFELDHGREISKQAGKLTDVPENRNTIPRLLNTGFKRDAEIYIESNPNPKDPKVKAILEEAKKLKVRIRPNVPTGTFKADDFFRPIANPLLKISDNISFYAPNEFHTKQIVLPRDRKGNVFFGLSPKESGQKKLSALQEIYNRAGMNLDPALAARAVKEQFVDPLTSRVPTGKGIRSLATAGKIALPESYFAPASIVLDTYAGRTPKEMALNVATLGFGAPAADAYRKAQVLKDLGFLSDYKKAMAKIDRPQQALAEEVETLGMDTPAEEFAAPEFTKDERLAALIGQVQDLKLNKRLGEKAAEYQELRENQLKKGLLEVTPDEEELPEDLGIKPEIPVGEEEEEENLGFFDRITGNIPRDFMSKGGIMATRLGFASGTGPFPLRMMFMIKDRMQNLKNSTFSNYNDVFRMGEQKGVKNILEPYINIPNKNKLTTALEDIAELKKIMPEEYQSVLDDIANDTKQFNFKTAHDRTEALAETIPSDMDFKKLSEDLFPMPNPENPSFILVGPDSPASAGRYSTTTTIDKFTGKGKRQVYDMFDEETGEFTRPGKLVEEEPLEEEYSEFIRDMDKPDETN